MCITRCLAACLVAGRTFVLGNDSDFYLFKGCRYVNFSDVVFVRPQGPDPAEQTVQVAVNVYTRAALSKLLAVSEKFLVDFKCVFLLRRFEKMTIRPDPQIGLFSESGVTSRLADWGPHCKVSLNPENTAKKSDRVA